VAQGGRLPQLRRRHLRARCQIRFRPHNMAVRHVLLVALTSLIALPSLAQKDPAGWRSVLQSDLGVDPDFRRPRDFRVRGDFNGDGRIDQARILIRESDPNARDLFVLLMDATGKQTSVKLHACTAGCGDYVLSVVQSGCYHEAMSAVRVCLRHHGLARIEAEYATGTLYWLERGKWRTLIFGQGTLTDSPR
jgi:hypothetical protein